MTSARPGASAPGKILLAGEYSVLEGGAAIVMAVNRRARAAVSPGRAAASSPFLAAAAAALAAELGPTSPAARAAAAVRVDTGALSAGSGAKLGLGSSAAATVAALAACLGAGGDGALDRALLHRLAHRAHADAQAGLAARARPAGVPSGSAAPHAASTRPAPTLASHAASTRPAPTRGSGADIAASVWGGILLLEPSADPDLPPAVSPLALPDGLTLVPVWTGQPADTRALVAATCALGARDPRVYAARLADVAAAAAALIEACRAGVTRDAVAAVAAGGSAVRELGRAASVPLYLDVHRVLAECAAPLGGAVKPTGAGGGDIALVAFDQEGRAEEFRGHVAGLGMEPLDLRVDPAGARLEHDARDLSG